MTHPSVQDLHDDLGAVAADGCPNCGAPGLRDFYDVRGVPVHSVLLVRSREDALRFPTGDLRLAFCSTCGFVTNRSFDGSLLNYSAEYEETQGFSPTFNAFHRRLAEDVVARHGLRGKRVIEIGCGKGEFLTLLCELGDNKGVGFDPAYVPERNRSNGRHNVTFIRDFYSERYADVAGDFVCCKMTLEHIPDTAYFLRVVRRAVGDRPETVVFFQIPETHRILKDVAFWDIYYEHCSYFSRGSLTHLFAHAGFDVCDVWTGYDDQYLFIEARPRTGGPPTTLDLSDEVEDTAAHVRAFEKRVGPRLDAWRMVLGAYRRDGQRVVLWGGGSKAVAFLTTLGLSDEVACAVDINPYKQGTFLAGTGHEIVGPDALTSLRPDVVIVMNPVYREEIRRDLERRHLAPILIDIDALPPRS